MKKLAFFSTQWEEGSPALHLLDRSLNGWPSNGRMKEKPFETISVYGHQAEKHLGERRKHPHLKVEKSIEKAIADADAWILAAGANNNWACCSQYLFSAIKLAPKSTRGFIVGFPTGLGTQQFEELIKADVNRIQVSTPLPWTWRLPETDIPSGAKLDEAVILIRGKFPTAEQEAMDALLALTSHRQGGESGIKKITRWTGNDVWKAARERRFSWDLFSAAVSRTNSKQGDAHIDGRTQDIVGLGKIPQLAKGTRAWVINHKDGLQSTIITVDGILNDDNFAVRTHSGEIFSAQFYRPPKPHDHQYSRLMDRISSYLIEAKNTLPRQRTQLWVNTIQMMQSMEKDNLSTVEVPDDGLRYALPNSTWTP